MRGATLLVCATLALCSVALAGLQTAERDALIDVAIKEAKDNAKLQRTSSANERNPSSIHRSFKKASPRAAAHGKARVLFEDMVRRAEKKLMESERMANRAILQGDKQARAEELAKELMHKPGKMLTKHDIARIYQASDCRDVLTTADCTDPDSITHRTLEGTCNNMENPTLGALNTPFRRLIDPRYEDGFSQPRGFMQSQNSELLHSDTFAPPNPSARVISVGVIEDRPVNSTEFSHWVMLWGGFLDHDLTLSPELPITCPEGCDFSNLDCVPIPVPLDDNNVLTTTSADNPRGCHMFRRTVPTCDSVVPPRLTPREQINGLNSYLDGEQFYSGDETINNAIRDLNSFGLLKVGPPAVPNGKPSLPITPNPDFVGGCSMIPNCFLTADIRVNENVGFMVIEVLWVREHNRIATRLHELNPNWSPDKVYLVTRDIVVAELAKITYDDYLPILIGDLVEPYTGYDPEVDPSVPNSWGTAAHRFGHSQVQPAWERLDESYQSIGALNLITSFFNPGEFFNQGGTDPFIRGLLTQPIRLVDEFVNSILTNQLFAANVNSMGLDLVSLNIQRGRDHGLPPYMVWKRWALKECGVSSEFRNELTKIHILQTYGSLETVDLFVGGVAEENLPGAMLGATFACIFSRTFANVRDGDRLYYENEDLATAIFNAAQRAEIKKFSLSRLICDNADFIDEVQPNAFSLTQQRVPCTDIPEVNLDVFQGDDATEPECFIRIEANNDRDATVLGTPSGDLLGSVSETAPIGTSPTCIPFICPSAALNTFVSVFVRFCSFSTSIMLPQSSNTVFYVSEISPSDISNNNGLYNSEHACNVGTDTALTYSCLGAYQQSREDSLIQAMENMLDVEKQEHNTMHMVSEGDPSVPEEVWEELRRLNGHKKSGEKLVGLLQEVLTELKKDEKSSSLMEDEGDLASELVDALNELQ